MTRCETRHGWRWAVLALLIACIGQPVGAAPEGSSRPAVKDAPPSGKVQRLLYVAVPGIRNDLQYGGHGVLVYDIDDHYKLLRRIPAVGLDEKGKPLNVKGICASVPLKRLFVSTTKTMTAFDLESDKVLWEKPYPGGCDRMSISPDGKTIYLPSLEGSHWNVVDAASGDVVATITPKSGAHNTLYGRSGKHVYLAGLKSPVLTIADAKAHEPVGKVGPFGDSIRPFTINGRETLVFCCVNNLLGFEVGDVASGKMIHRVEVKGFEKGQVKRHGCPSHGVGLTADEKELWVCDAANSRMHVFDATVMPPKQVADIAVSDQPGWITFSLDGKHAWPSTGDVIDVATRKTIAHLQDEAGKAAVQSEKMLEIDFADGKPLRAGDQFGIGRVLPPFNRDAQRSAPP